tara:strand:- start:746 stop:1480 length:735 start_codon:yes stop_codon:yes gene_type:complete
MGKKKTIKEKRKARIQLLKRMIPGFKEERLVDFPIQLRVDTLPYDDPRFKEGFVNQEDRTFHFDISDETEDSYDTVFLTDGWDLKYREMGKRYVTYQHPPVGDKDPNVIIGMGYEDVKKKKKKLVSKLVLEPFNTNTTADQVCNKLHFGSLTDASVVAYIMDGHSGKQERGENEDIFYFSHQMLITWGVVMRGANENAMKRSFDRAMDSLQQSKRDITSDIDDLIESQKLRMQTIWNRNKIGSR